MALNHDLPYIDLYEFALQNKLNYVACIRFDTEDNAKELLIELISMLKTIENNGLTERDKNKSPAE